MASDFLCVDLPALRDDPVRASGHDLLERVRSSCAAAEATFWTVSDDGMTLHGGLNVGATPHIVEALSVPVSQSLVGLVAAMRLASSFGPEDEFNRSVDEQAGTKTEAMVAAPVLAAGRLCGVVSAINPRGGGSFSAAQLEALQELARELGSLIADHLDAPSSDAQPDG